MVELDAQRPSNCAKTTNGEAVSLEPYFRRENIGGKDVYVVDDHHKALAPWALVRRMSPQAPALITIDHHTDTHEAFWNFGYHASREKHAQSSEAIRASLVEAIDWRDDDSVSRAIERLKHDEHIDAATQAGILSNAWCMQLSDSGGTQLATASGIDLGAGAPTHLPEVNRIYILSHDCSVGCQARPHNDACYIRQCGQVIDGPYLEDQLRRLRGTAQRVGLPAFEVDGYILDIDLDVFHTRAAVNPPDPSAFYRLINEASAITIATEAECVAELWRDDDHRVDTVDLLADVKRHIEIACRGRKA